MGYNSVADIGLSSFV